jgi:hypothetical protein
MGAHITTTGYPKDYQLRRRLETLAEHLEKRRLDGHPPLKRHVVEIRAIRDEIIKYSDRPLRGVK